MREFAACILVSSVCSAPLLAQERERSLERIAIALEQPRPIVRGVAPVDDSSPKKLGIFTLLPPTSRGEIVRVSIPIGELVTRAFTGVVAVNQRRQAEAARRKVEAALERFAKRALF